MNIFNLTLDLNKGKTVSVVRIRQGDLNGTTIAALILDHGATADLTGLTAEFVMELPDGEHYYRKAATVSGSTVTVTIDETQAASVTGRTRRAYFQLIEGETVKASTGSIIVDVLPDAIAGKTVPESYDNEIEQALEEIATATGNANAATGNANAATANANTATGNANAAATAANAAGDWANEAAARAESAVAHNIKIWFDYEDVGGRKLLTLCTTEGEE